MGNSREHLIEEIPRNSCEPSRIYGNIIETMGINHNLYITWIINDVLHFDI